jgi:hypothetical protein
MRTGLIAVVVAFGLTATTITAQGRCDRACLIGISDTYIDALVAHDPSKAPLAANVKYTENGQRLRPGDGFWNSVAGKGTYKLQIADPTGGQIVTQITMREAGNPPLGVVLAVRLKVVDPHHRGRHLLPQRRGRLRPRTPREAFKRVAIESHAPNSCAWPTFTSAA